MNNKDDQIKTLYRRLEDLSKLYIDDNVYKEIESVLDQLDELDPMEYDEDYYSTEKALERFWDRYGNAIK